MTDAPTPPKRAPRVWWRAFLLALPLFVIGVAVGAYFVHDFDTRVQPGFAAMFDEHMLSQYAYLQYQQASYQEAQAALERYLKLLSSPAQSPNPLSDQRTRRFDSMLTWGRLALLHERNGRPDLADVAWHHAEILAKETSWKDPSRQRIRSFLERVDSQPKELPQPPKTERPGK
jgi:hypothetical protein